MTEEMQDLVALLDLFQLVLIMVHLQNPLIDLILDFKDFCHQIYHDST